MEEVAKLEVQGKTLDLPLIKGTEDETAIDITKLRAKTGLITLDNGFMNTGACLSSITFLDGEKGILRYRGYSIEELAEKSNFVETSYLLMKGELPNKAQTAEFRSKLDDHANLPRELIKFYEVLPENAHPMGVLASSISLLSAFYPEDNLSKWNEQDMERVMLRMQAKIKMMAAYFYRTSRGLPLVNSEPKRGYCNDFINMMFNSGPGFEVDDAVAKALNTLLILHADHEQNCSTSSVRAVGSSEANPYAAISAGISALWGPIHGGANQAVLEMLDLIQKDGGGYKKFIDKAKDKNSDFRLMGFGHRVYKNFDPRSRIIKKLCDFILAKLGVQDPLLDIAKGLAEAALSDPYFIERKLYPNVDFYSGIIYRALGIPSNMFTVMFAIGRLPGWLSQWKEMTLDPQTKIIRPRQIYTGQALREFVSLEAR